MSQPEVKFVQANGLRHAYIEEGSGPLVLMFHGFPDTARTWDELRPMVAAAGFRVVTPYLRGYAPSQIPDTDTDIATQGDDALALIDALEPGGSAALVGHDWGASTVYAAAARGPQKVNKLVTMAIPHPASLRPTPKLLWGVRHFVAFKLPGAVRRFERNQMAQIEVLFKRWSPTWKYTPEDVDEVRRAFGEPGCLNAALGYYRAAQPGSVPKWQQARLGMPALLFAGADDPVIGPESFEPSKRFFTGDFEVASVPGGHFLHRESPKAVAERLISFLKAT